MDLGAPGADARALLRRRRRDRRSVRGERASDPARSRATAPKLAQRSAGDAREDARRAPEHDRALRPQARRGGMVDIEFIVQYLVLAHAARASRADRATSATSRCCRMAARPGLHRRGLADRVADAYRTFRRSSTACGSRRGARPHRPEAVERRPRRSGASGTLSSCSHDAFAARAAVDGLGARHHQPAQRRSVGTGLSAHPAVPRDSAVRGATCAWTDRRRGRSHSGAAEARVWRLVRPRAARQGFCRCRLWTGRVRAARDRLRHVWPLLLLLRVLDRLGKGLRSSPRDALLAQAVPAAQRGLAFGLHRAFDNAAQS